MKVPRRDTLLMAGAALALVAALFNPGFTMQRPLYEQVIVLDITQSMNVPDEQLGGKPVSRLDFARHALRGALLDLPCGSKVGWGVFTEYRSFLLLAPVEVCTHLDELRGTLDRIDGRMAWAGNSEVSKAIHSGLAISGALPGKPALVFITDGQEAPPLNPRHRPRFDDKPGEIAGLLVGVGGIVPAAIPKRDAQGRPLGFWKADEVLQVDPRSKGRGGSVGNEQMADDAGGDGASASLGATPGREHLSALREPYLQLLAGEYGLQYQRLVGAEGLSEALRGAALARPVAARVDGRLPLSALALLLLAIRHAPRAWLLRHWPRWRLKPG
ncbi:hypothetical protein [Pelomonas sp. KK5]|uniref:hypothetical protein n=1 Tax=Pelomonas sp. KK5 TaxID=1855730 RepID=UPI00097C9EDB|nr:hypothetical protein [Pelomonas sp. KK5]